MEIYQNIGPNRTKVCKTNSLDMNLVNDWKVGTIAKYCGKKFMGECSGKNFGENFEVNLVMSNWLLHNFNQRDELCLEEIKHFQKGSNIHFSISKGWSKETGMPGNYIPTQFVQGNSIFGR